MNISRLVLGVFVIGLAATFYVTALGYPDKAANMPLIYSVVVALLGAAMVGQEIISTLRRRKVSVEGAATASDADPEETAVSEQEHQRKPWKAMLIFLLAAVYLLAVGTICGLCPYLLVHMQKSRSHISGPWDAAVRAFLVSQEQLEGADG